MPNLAAMLKAEVSRIARKAIRAETQALKKAVAGYRADIVALKRRIQALEQDLRRLGKRQAEAPAPADLGDDAPTRRFSAKGLASQRKRLGLSAHDCGLLLGTSGQSVYQWERGNTRPRSRHLAGIAALRTMGKKEASARLIALGEKS